MSLTGKVALVVVAVDGPNSLEPARNLAAQGVSLALSCDGSSEVPNAIAFRKELAKTYPDVAVSIHIADFSTAEGISNLLVQVTERHGKINFVINSTGSLLHKPGTSTSSADSSKFFAYAIFVDKQRRRSVEQLTTEIGKRTDKLLSTPAESL